MTAHSHSEVQYFRTCPEESPSSWSTNVAQNVIPEIHKNVILEIFYRGSKYFVIPNLIGDPVFIFLFLPIRTENSLFFLFICLKKKYFLDSRFRGNDKRGNCHTRNLLLEDPFFLPVEQTFLSVFLSRYKFKKRWDHTSLK